MTDFISKNYFHLKEKKREQGDFYILNFIFMYVCLHCKTYLTANVYDGRNIFQCKERFSRVRDFHLSIHVILVSPRADLRNINS